MFLRDDGGIGHLDVMHRESGSFPSQVASGILEPGPDLLVCLAHGYRPLYSSISFLRPGQGLLVPVH